MKATKPLIQKLRFTLKAVVDYEYDGITDLLDLLEKIREAGDAEITNVEIVKEEA